MKPVIYTLLIVFLLFGIVYYFYQKQATAAQQQAEAAYWQEWQAQATPLTQIYNPLNPWNQQDASRGFYGKSYFNLGQYLNKFFGI